VREIPKLSTAKRGITVDRRLILNIDNRATPQRTKYAVE